MPVPTCGSACGDVGQMAGNYAQFAEILAGFAFLAIVLVLQTRVGSGSSGTATISKPSKGLEHVVICFMTAFIGGIVGSFMFVMISREDTTAARAVSEIFVSGFTISIAVLNLFYGVVWLFHTWRMRDTTRVTIRVTAVVVPVLLFTFTETIGLDAISVDTGEHALGINVAKILMPMLVFLILFSIFSLKSRALVPIVRRLSTDVVVRTASYVSLGVVFTASLAGGLISAFDVSAGIPVYIVILVMIYRVAILCAFVLLVQAVPHRATEEA